MGGLESHEPPESPHRVACKEVDPWGSNQGPPSAPTPCTHGQWQPLSQPPTIRRDLSSRCPPWGGWSHMSPQRAPTKFPTKSSTPWGSNQEPSSAPTPCTHGQWQPLSQPPTITHVVHPRCIPWGGWSHMSPQRAPTELHAKRWALGPLISSPPSPHPLHPWAVAAPLAAPNHQA
jgi:hypothetical protein